ncbi:MAG: hypothetical protein IT324_26190 [Anaerolineae bacterium]|nr:hypothetical protein [Anaerolineae bacterium]
MTLQDILEQAQALPLTERRELIKRLVDTLTVEHDTQSSEMHSIMGLRGLGKEIWQGVDVQQYLDEMRNEWDRRV